MPKLLERRNWDLWEDDGAMDIFKVAERKTLEMRLQIRYHCCRQKSKIKLMKLSGRHRISKLIVPNPDPPETEN